MNPNPKTHVTLPPHHNEKKCTYGIESFFKWMSNKGVCRGIFCTRMSLLKEEELGTLGVFDGYFSDNYCVAGGWSGDWMWHNVRVCKVTWWKKAYVPLGEINTVLVKCQHYDAKRVLSSVTYDESELLYKEEHEFNVYTHYIIYIFFLLFLPFSLFSLPYLSTLWVWTFHM